MAELRRTAGRNQNLVPTVVEALDRFASGPHRPRLSGAVAEARAGLAALDPRRRDRALAVVEAKTAAALSLVLSLAGIAGLSTAPEGVRVLTGGTALLAVVVIARLRRLWMPWVRTYSELTGVPGGVFGARPYVIIFMAVTVAAVVRALVSGDAADLAGGLYTLAAVALIAVEAELLWGRRKR
nr:hypothetical protein KPHV_87520 [Kitasatospora purpeofusca]